MPTLVTGFLGIFSLLAILLFYLASSDVSDNLSPQGCRMSWMSPSYVQQANFNESWSSLSRRYSLWLYREVGWDSLERRSSLPVLFIPGNAGSSHQVRSIASSATRQYFSSPYEISSTFRSRSLQPLDFFAVEFNEDLSAFHSATLESQTAYSAQAISYILSLYPPETKIIVMGHSMGGIVATSLLPSNNISTVITMSTPHTLPPARFDFRIDKLYRKLQTILEDDPTPIVSICGGATDTMIPSESCILPRTSKGVFRRTVFTSALEGAWTGVGHREMVWCHQVRWRVARAALELGAANDGSSRSDDSFDPTDAETLSLGQKLVLRHPRESKRYLLPYTAIPLRVSIFSCIGSSVADCVSLKPETLKLVPSPIPGKSFPAPQEGSDESEGVVLYEGHIPKTTRNNGAMAKAGQIAVHTTTLDAGLCTSFSFPNLISNALVVYRVTAQPSAISSCALLSPLLMHTSHAAETHYFPLAMHTTAYLIHTHLDAPFIDQARISPHIWAAGVASMIMFFAWAPQDAVVPNTTITVAVFPSGIPDNLGSPFPEWVYTGNKASGLVCMVWWILFALLAVIGKLSTFVYGSRSQQVSVPRSTILSLSIICLTIFVFVPWQNTPLRAFIPRLSRLSDAQKVKENNLRHNMHLLLLMTWLLPLTAPVLAVWVRTLLTAGYTTPFDGDHNFLAVLPFLIYVDFASWTPGPLFERTKFEKRLPLRWVFVLAAGTAFVYGSRKPYLVLDVARVAMWIIVVSKVGRRYWGGLPWTDGNGSGQLLTRNKK
ncbi:GPI-inositol-deacylase [Pholiota molesta]|nr:GPI-inositol-deacylase [Pholiota molesta]